MSIAVDDGHSHVVSGAGGCTVEGHEVAITQPEGNKIKCTKEFTLTREQVYRITGCPFVQLSNCPTVKLSNFQLSNCPTVRL